jgi:hypothetical protein
MEPSASKGRSPVAGMPPCQPLVPSLEVTRCPSHHLLGILLFDGEEEAGRRVTPKDRGLPSVMRDDDGTAMP